MTDAVSAEVIPMICLPNGKKFPAPSVFSNIEADDFATLGGAPYFDVDALAVDGFVDQYAFDGFLPGNIPLEWTQSWC